jgi:hypothetical protein
MLSVEFGWCRIACLACRFSFDVGLFGRILEGMSWNFGAVDWGGLRSVKVAASRVCSAKQQDMDMSIWEHCP